MPTLTEQQAETLITDPGTLKRGRELTKPGNWSNLGQTELAAWGECAGSGKTPYQVGIDLADIAFKCTCPSWVFPCKHGAGLLLLLARQPALLALAAPPAWFAEWLDKRLGRQEKQREKADQQLVEAAPKAGEALAKEAATRDKREAERLERMQRGVADLETWLTDLIGSGLATAPSQPGAFWEQQAARLVDDQLPGLAIRLRGLAALPYAAADWPDLLLAALGELLLLTTAFRRFDQQPPAVQAEIAQQVGWSLKKEEVYKEGERVSDRWQVLLSFPTDVADNPRLQQRTTWLFGYESNRLAMLLDFTALGQPYATHYAARTVVAGELAFYPGLLPVRAVPGPAALTIVTPQPSRQLMPTPYTPTQLLDAYADALARNPWLREFAACLADVQLVAEGELWWAVHPGDHARLPLEIGGNGISGWSLLAQCGPRLSVVGTWNGRQFRVLLGIAPDDPAVIFAPGAVVGGEEPPRAEASAEPLALPRWDELRRTALIGTRQAGPLPDLGFGLPHDPAASPEAQLLLAAGALALVRRAGFVPPLAGNTPYPAQEVETRPEAPPAVADCLRGMLLENAPRELLPSYLERLAARGWRLSKAWIVPVLSWAAEVRTTLPDLAPLLGARGRWIASIHPDWPSLAAAASDAVDPTVWEVGSTAARRGYLESLLVAAPAKARELLAAALPHEPAKVQVELMQPLREHLLPADETLLEGLLKSRSRDVRQTAARLLACLPDTALIGRLWARAVPLLQVKQGLLGFGKSTLNITLPGEWTKEWLFDGIEERAHAFLAPAQNDQALGDRATRLGAILALLPPSRWSAHFHQDPAALLSAALNSEWPTPLLPAWASAALLHEDVPWATALLRLRVEAPDRLRKAQVLDPVNWIALAHLLPLAERIGLLLPPLVRLVEQNESGWFEAVGLLPAPWPTALTRVVVDRLGYVLASPLPPNYWGFYGLFEALGLSLIADADARWAADTLQLAHDQASPFEKPLAKLIHTLRFRHELQSSLRP